LPAAGDAEAEAGQRDASAAGEGGVAAGVVLVIEDEEPLRNAVSRLLQMNGYRVLEARDGSEAVAMLQTHAAELTAMLLDVTLPGITSPDIFREAISLRPNLRIIVTSAYSDETVATIFAGLSPPHFVRKPMRIADLLKLLG
jgi:CheY-like chemotaxis protein